MDIGIGLPAQIPDVAGRTLVDWAVRAEQAGFSTLGSGCDELIFAPGSARLDQVTLLAEAAT